MRAYPLFAVAALLSLACQNHADPLFARGKRLLTKPVEVGNKLAYVDHESDRAFLVDASAPDGRTVTVQLPVNPTRAETRHGDHRAAIILSAGRLGSAKSASANAALSVVEEDGALSIYETGTDPFDVLYQSDDGRFVVLLRSEAGDRLVKNVNELALLDLDRAPGEEGAITPITLMEPPRKVVFLEDITLDGDSRRVAVVLSASTVTFLDLEHPARRPTEVDLSYNSSRNVWPDQVLLDAERARIYVRSLASNDVFAMRLESRDVEPSRNDFSVNVDIVAAGRAPTDIQLYQLDGQTRLLVVAEGSQELISVDVDTSRRTVLHLGSAPDRAMVYYVASGERQLPFVLLWDEDGPLLYSVALDDLESNLSRNVTELPRLSAPVSEAVVLEGESRVLLVHRYGGLSIVDAALGTVTPFAASGSLGEALLDEPRRRLWLAPPGQRRIAHLDALEGVADEFELDVPVLGAVLLERAGKLAITHTSAVGYVTFIDLDEPSRESAWSARGFLLEGLFD